MEIAMAGCTVPSPLSACNSTVLFPSCCVLAWRSSVQSETWLKVSVPQSLLWCRQVHFEQLERSQAGLRLQQTLNETPQASVRTSRKVSMALWSCRWEKEALFSFPFSFWTLHHPPSYREKAQGLTNIFSMPAGDGASHRQSMGERLQTAQGGRCWRAAGDGGDL